MQAEQGGADTQNWGAQWFATASTGAVDARDNVPVVGAPLCDVFER